MIAVDLFLLWAPWSVRTRRYVAEHQHKLVSKILEALKVSESIYGGNLKHKQGGRTFLGSVITTVQQFFDTIDQDGSRTIDQEEFGVLCQRIDLGLTEKQEVQLWGAFDLNGDSNVSYDEFEDILVSAEARKMTGKFQLVSRMDCNFPTWLQ